MKKSLLLFALIVASFAAYAGDSMKVKVVSSESRRPVAYVNLTVEYPDTVVTYQTDRKGRLKFTPSSFPLTMTARAEGMLDAILGFMSMPPKAEVIELLPDPEAPVVVPKRRADWSTGRHRRLSSVYVVRTPAPK